MTRLIASLPRTDENLIIGNLRELHGVQRTRAGRWLVGAWAQIHDRAEADSSADLSLPLDILEKALNWVYRDVISEIPDAAALRLRAVIPSADQVAAVRALLGGGDEPSHFVDRLPGEDEGFRAKLRQAYDAQISGYREQYVTGKGLAERSDPGNLHSMERIGRIALKAAEFWDRVFGRFVTAPALVPDRPDQPGTIHDQFDYVHGQVAAMTESERYEKAAIELADYLHAGSGNVHERPGRAPCQSEFRR